MGDDSKKIHETVDPRQVAPYACNGCGWLVTMRPCRICEAQRCSKPPIPIDDSLVDDAEQRARDTAIAQAHDLPTPAEIDARAAEVGDPHRPSKPRYLGQGRPRVTREVLESRLELHDQIVAELLGKIASRANPQIAEDLLGLVEWIASDRRRMLKVLFLERRFSPGRHGKPRMEEVHVQE